MKQLTDEQINKSVHAILHPDAKIVRDWSILGQTKKGVEIQQIPDYCGDLNLAATVEQRGLEMDFEHGFSQYDERSFPNRYTDALEKLCGDGTFEIATADARTRLLACLKAMEIEKAD